MSLDVYLTLEGYVSKPGGSGIFIRENGTIKELSRSEWDSKHPGTEPIIMKHQDEDECVYHDNITHNLNKMADEAGVYQCMWRPDEIGIAKASQLIDPLNKGLKLLKSDPNRFKAFNPSNGWGDYEGLVRFVSNYLDACIKYPEAKVKASR